MSDDYHPLKPSLEDYATGRLINLHAINNIKQHLPCKQCEDIILEAKHVAEEDGKVSWLGRLFHRSN